MFVQLNPPIPVSVIDKGDGFAVGVIDYGQEHNLIWVTALNASGEIWCVPNPKVRMQKNWTMGRQDFRQPPKGEDLGEAKTLAASAEPDKKPNNGAGTHR